jgi:hypothetical protein
VLFHIGIWSLLTIYHHLNLLSSPSPHTSTPPHILPIFQPWFLLLIFKLVFKDVSQFMPTVGGFTLVGSISLNTLPYSFTSQPHFSTNILISSTFTSYGMLYYWCSIILIPFPSFPEFHRVVPLLQICSIFEFVYDHAYFVYMFIFRSIFCIWEKICIFCVSDPG